MSRLQGFVAAARQRVAAGHYDVKGGPLPPHGPLLHIHAGRSARREVAEPDAPPRRVATGSGAQAGSPSGGDTRRGMAHGGGHEKEAGVRIIAELKPASPSSGRLLHRPAHDVLQAYRAGGADALSILTDSDFFDGSLSLLRDAHRWGLPTLMKDFVVDAQQVEAAAHHGASAVLLIERILEPIQRERLVEAAHRRGMQVLLEVFDADWETARHSAADAIGVNARDLETLHVDQQRQSRLVEEVAAAGRHVVALSGVRTRGDVAAAHEAGATAVLVGTMLMRQHDPALALRSLRRPLAKVCGVTDDATLGVAADAGADLVGLVVLSPGSPRDMPVPAAARLARAAQQRGVPPVLVTSCPDADAVVAAAQAVRPSFVQWHGAPADAAQRLHAAGIGFLAAVTPTQDVPAEADGFVVDSDVAGGSGRTHAWEATRPLYVQPMLSLVAGGLAADNVQTALQATHAWGADASSRLESAPGRKDPARIQQFVAAAHATPPPHHATPWPHHATPSPHHATKPPHGIGAVPEDDGQPTA